MMSPQNVEEEEEEEEGLDGGAKPKNHHVVQQLEKEAKDGFAAKKSNPHPLPKEMFRKLTAFLDKYGEDFEVYLSLHKLRVRVFCFNCHC